MKEPPMFRRLLNDWISMPRVINESVEKGHVAREPHPGWVPLMGLSAMSDALPPKSYAHPEFARAYNQHIRKFRRRAAISAFLARISRADLEAQLEFHALLMAGLQRAKHDPMKS